MLNRDDVIELERRRRVLLRQPTVFAATACSTTDEFGKRGFHAVSRGGPASAQGPSGRGVNDVEHAPEVLVRLDLGALLGSQSACSRLRCQLVHALAFLIRKAQVE